MCTTGVAIDGHNNEVKERHIQLVKKRGNVRALDEELYSKWNVSPVRAIQAAWVSLKSFIPEAPKTKNMNGWIHMVDKWKAGSAHTVKLCFSGCGTGLFFFLGGGA